MTLCLTSPQIVRGRKNYQLSMPSKQLESLCLSFMMVRRQDRRNFVDVFYADHSLLCGWYTCQPAVYGLTEALTTNNGKRAAELMDDI